MCGQTHRYNVVYRPFLAKIYGNVILESPPASLFHRGIGALCSAIRAATNLTLDFNTTAAGLEKIGTSDKWLRQGT